MKKFFNSKVNFLIALTVCMISGKVYAQMEWQNPVPVGCWLGSVCYTDSVTIHATAYFGYLLKSTDGGETWKTTKLKTSASLGKVEFTDSQTGYAASIYDLYKTVDGGETWSKMEISAGFDIMSMHFFDNNTGIISGFGKIIKTTDGGVTWQTIFEHENDIYYSMSFPNASTGIILGESYTSTSGTYSIDLKTNDGGSTWTRTPYDDYILQRDVCFITSDTGFISCYDKLCKTTNGGVSWDTIAVLSSWINTIESYNNVLYAGLENGEIARSNDNGYSWVTVKGSNASDVQCLAFYGNKGFGTGRGYNGHFPVTYKSDDAGLTWQTTYPVTEEHLFSVSFCDSLNGFACGKNRTMIHTSDGGKHWEIQSVQPYLLTYNSVFCADPLTAYCVDEDGYIHKTNDGGSTWSSYYTTHPDLQKICFINSNKGYCVGDNGLILQTTDAGNNWNQIESGADKSLNATSFVNENIGYISGDNNVVLKTTDGGNTWEFNMLSTLDNFKSISFINENVGYVAGNELHKTYDGGITWEEIYSSNRTFFDIKYTDENHGYAASSEGIRYTVDGGNNWEIWDQGPYNVSRSIDITDSGSCYFVGDYGMVLRFSDIDNFMTEIKSLSNKTNVILYPNPADNFITIAPFTSKNGYSDVVLFDINGKLRMKFRVESTSSKQLDVCTLEAGIYFIRISSGNEVSTVKLVVTR